MARLMARKHKWEVMRFRRRNPEHNLLAAVTHWIRAHGGRALIIGGIEVQDFHEGMGKFRIAVRACGQMPKKYEAVRMNP